MDSLELFDATLISDAFCRSLTSSSIVDVGLNFMSSSSLKVKFWESVEAESEIVISGPSISSTPILDGEKDLESVIDLMILVSQEV